MARRKNKQAKARQRQVESAVNRPATHPLDNVAFFTPDADPADTFSLDAIANERSKFTRLKPIWERLDPRTVSGDERAALKEISDCGLAIASNGMKCATLEPVTPGMKSDNMAQLEKQDRLSRWERMCDRCGINYKTVYALLDTEVIHKAAKRTGQRSEDYKAEMLRALRVWVDDVPK